MSKWRTWAEGCSCGFDLGDDLPPLLDLRFADDILSDISFDIFFDILYDILETGCLSQNGLSQNGISDHMIWMLSKLYEGQSAEVRGFGDLAAIFP